MATKTKEPKIVIEREYIVPLRKAWLKVPYSKRANKAAKAIKEFMVQHMKDYDRNLDNVKIDIYLNNELRYRGMKKPPAKIKVIAKKYDDGIIRVELVKLPTHLEFAKAREEKKGKKKEKKTDKEEKKEEISEEKKEEAKEKEEASKEENLEIAKVQAKENKHVSKEKKVMTHRKSLAR